MSGAAGRTWLDPVSLQATAKYETVTAVAAGPEGWVAVGSATHWEDDSSGGEHFKWRTGRVWSSADGAEWTALQDDTVFENAQIDGVSWTSQGYVAVGLWKDERADASGEAGRTQTFGIAPAAWRSTDGVRWISLPVVAEPGDDLDAGRMKAVVEVDGRLIAVGCLDENCLSGPAMWVSGTSGGFTPATDVPAPEAAAVNDVIATHGGLVAVGTYNSVGDAPSRAAAWTSVDGERWLRSGAIEDGAYSAMRGVARIGDVLIAVGDAATEDRTTFHPAVWRSMDDGATWQSIAPSTFGGYPGTYLQKVVFTGAALVAVGRANDSEPRAAAWVSPDGETWQRVEMPGGGAWAVSIADGPDGLIAVGGFKAPWVGEETPAIPPAMLTWRSPAGAR